MKAGKPKELYSTGDVAKICDVTINTVVKWFEAGELKGRRTSKRGARRITRKSLFSFLKRQNFPPDTAAGERFGLVIVDDDKSAVSLFKKAFGRDHGYAVEAASSRFEAGLLAERLKPNIVFVCVDVKDLDAGEMAEHMRSRGDAQKTPVVAMGRRLGARRREKLSEHFDAILAKPLKVAQVKEIVAAHSS
jgi:CheY-like chemotaxis protein